MEKRATYNPPEAFFELMEDLDVLDSILVGEDEGLIDFDDWCRIQKVIMKYTDVAL